MLQFIFNPIKFVRFHITSFNTSHVVVYLVILRAYRLRPFVSIHLMLQFICIVFFIIGLLISVSIHLMLQFITFEVPADTYRNQFQYISCCSLSIMNTYKVRGYYSFNTSHVVVYLTEDRPLSKQLEVSIHLMLQFICQVDRDGVLDSKFQYISCCSLSSSQYSQNKEVDVSIHLMLQFILLIIVPFPIVKIVSIHLMLQFIYDQCQLYSKKNRVSIHLMLQFIPGRTENFNYAALFQYISCCSLSGEKLVYHGSWKVSIHLMLQFIAIGYFADWYSALFQYISCCSLSCWRIVRRKEDSVSIHLMLQFINFL